MYTLYYSPGAASMLVHLVLLEIGAPHLLERVDLDAGQQRSAAYLALNPNGVVPTLVVDGVPHGEAAAPIRPSGTFPRCTGEGSGGASTHASFPRLRGKVPEGRMGGSSSPKTPISRPAPTSARTRHRVPPAPPPGPRWP